VSEPRLDEMFDDEEYLAAIEEGERAAPPHASCLP
jgi:hypothetical protein